jgi:hypothetical protein
MTGGSVRLFLTNPHSHSTTPLVKMLKLLGEIMKLIQAIQAIEERGRTNIVHVQSVLPQEDVIALKEKAHESSIKEAISKAVYHYLKCDT